MNRALMLFVRLPEPGRVKTRLARQTSDQQAASLYDALARQCLSRCQEAAQQAKAGLLVLHDPDSDPQVVAGWLGSGVTLLAQSGPDLGARMAHAFSRAFERGFDAAVLVGSDVPGMTAEDLARALALPQPGTAVLGPALDGGYWLIGFHSQGYSIEVADTVFQAMPWSTPLVAAETMRRMAEAGLDLRLAPERMDVDLLEDLERALKAGQLDPESEAGRLAGEMLRNRAG